MGTATIYRLPGSARRRWRLARHGRETLRLWAEYPANEAVVAMLAATLGLAWLYFSGAAGMKRHDLLYGTLLAGAWAGLFYWDALVESRVVGPFLGRTVRVVSWIAGLAFVPAMYGIILGR
jgi:hypothetical protein